MAGDTGITIIGNLTGDPELKFLPSGVAVANFTIASTPRSFDRQANEWKDGETLFMPCAVWRDAAENVAESLQRGDKVIASGNIKQRSYTTKEGDKRTVVEMDVQEIGPALSRGTARLQKVNRQGQGQQQQNAGQWGQQPPQQGGWGGQGGWGQPQGQPPGWAQQPPQQPAQQPPQQGGWGQQGNPNANPPDNPNAGPGGWQPPGPGY